jgi:phage FluMu protein Com
MIRLACSHCERTLQVKPEVAGHRIYCPHCRHVNRVPAATEAATLPPAAPMDAATLPPAPAQPETATLPPSGMDASGTPSGLPLAAFTEAPPATLPPGADRAASSTSAAGADNSPAGYEILAELGRGGMGVVYKARQRKLDRLVALKMILAGGHAGAAELTRFRTEGEAIARLQHPNIVQVYEVAEHEGRPFFSLEFCPGGSLDRQLDGTPLAPAEGSASCGDVGASDAGGAPGERHPP